MKRILNFLLILSVVACSALGLIGCNKKDDTTPYVPQLTKTHTSNGFKIQTTSDFTLQTTTEGVKLTSEGDNQVSFGDTYLYAQYDMGSEHYSFDEVTLAKYTQDVANIEGLNLPSDSKQIDMIEENLDGFKKTVTLNMYVVDEMKNVDGNYDWYTILCVGKSSNAFVCFKVYTTIQDQYYNDNIDKYSAIIGSTILTTPVAKTYNDSVKSYISSTMVKTEDVMAYWSFEFLIPNDYVAYENPSYIMGNHLHSEYSLEEYWSSSIRCNELASFMGDTILDDDAAQHLIRFSTSNYLGFYTKTVTDQTNVSYNIYYLDSNNKLIRNCIIIDVGYSDDLADLNFGNYFEEQMISWMRGVEILPQ